MKSSSCERVGSMGRRRSVGTNAGGECRGFVATGSQVSLILWSTCIDMANLAKDLARQLGDFPEAKAEFELRYTERDPPSSAFAYDLLHLDREVRRAAREVRDGVIRGPIEERRRRRPLGIDQGLVVVGSHRSDFSFLLEVPPGLYHFILSDPVEFAVRVFELSALFAGAKHAFLRRRGVSDEDVQEESLADTQAGHAVPDTETVPDKGASGGTVERIQRVRLPNGFLYEVVERVER
jgi:hypothetical protein